MKTIRSILEELTSKTINKLIAENLDTTELDQALAEIEDLMNECKTMDCNLDEYQSNLHKALGKE